jgi:hypothetical protein
MQWQLMWLQQYCGICHCLKLIGWASASGSRYSANAFPLGALIAAEVSTYPSALVFWSGTVCPLRAYSSWVLRSCWTWFSVIAALRVDHVLPWHTSQSSWRDWQPHFPYSFHATKETHNWGRPQSHYHLNEAHQTAWTLQDKTMGTSCRCTYLQTAKCTWLCSAWLLARQNQLCWTTFSPTKKHLLTASSPNSLSSEGKLSQLLSVILRYILDEWHGNELSIYFVVEMLRPNCCVSGSTEITV